MQPKKHYFAHIPTIAIFIVFAMSAPLGVLLFILKSIDKSAEKEETAAAQAQADYRSDLGPAPAQTAPRQENEPAYGHDVPTKEQKDAKERHKTPYHPVHHRRCRLSVRGLQHPVHGWC